MIKNNAEARGGAICVMNTTNSQGATPNSGSAKLTISGVTIGGSDANKNTASGSYGFGGGVYVKNDRASATINGDTKISYNQSYYGGNGICVADLGAVTLGACEIAYNIPYNSSTTGIAGGGIAVGGTVADGAKVTVGDGCKIHHNKAIRGAGVCLQSNMELEMTGGSIYNNTTTSGGEGGGVYIKGDANNNQGKFTMSGGSIYSNTATSAVGGGVYLGAGTVTISGGSIYSNTATNGGGIYNNLGSATLSGSPVIRNNTASSNGGGIYLNNGTLTMSGGQFYGNTATSYGGGVYLTANCTLSMTGGSIGVVGQAQNTAKRGGGIYDLGKFTMNGTNATIANNKATTDLGGGAYINTSQDTKLTKGYIISNEATTNGGGIYVDGSSAVTCSGVSFYGNKATGNADNNGYGGGVYLTKNCTFSMTGGSIGVVGQAKNSAKRGGGIYDLGKFTMNGANATIANNEATADHGGGAYISTTQATSLTNGSVVGNTAASNGGGIYIGGGSAITASGVSIYDNIATNNGGGIYITSNTGNSFTMSSGSIGKEGHPNKAKNGGGVYDSYTFKMTGGSISYNEVSNQGGGAFIDTNQATTLTGATINNNTATKEGGGIFLNQGSVQVENTAFTANYAKTSGGGIYTKGNITIKGTSSFTKNHADADGGAGYVNDGVFTLSAGTIGGSTANANYSSGGNGGGVYITGDNAKVVLSGGSITYNTALSTTSNKGNGGGIYVASTGTDGTAISGGVMVDYNKAKHNGGGIYVVSGKVSLTGTSTSVLTSISNNTAETNNGGGVYLGGGQFTLGKYSVISTNHADNGNGGGVYVGGTSPVYTQNGTGSNVQGNTANYGAGLYMDGGTCNLSAGYIQANTADNDGGGVYMNGGTFNHSAGQIGNQYASPNQAVNGGGLYVKGGSYYSTAAAARINGNKATADGGGIYMNGGNCYLQGGYIGYDGSSQLNSAVNGAGLYMAGTGHFEMTNSGSDIRGNHASGNGGGIYMEGGTCSITAGNIGTSSYNNQAANGGGIYAQGGTITVNGGSVNYNTASTSGGGIYANDGTVNFSNGNVNYNVASETGGGIFVNTNGTLNLSGTATLAQNRVPAGKKGGGVYLLGVVVVGSTGGSQGHLTSDRLLCETNYSDAAGATITDANRNNIYLPNPVAYPVGSSQRHVDVITVIPWGMASTSRVGFSVPHNFVPVVYSTSIPFLDYLLANKASTIVFDDTHSYLAVRVDDDPTLDPNHIYLEGFWPDVVTSAPSGFDPMNINTPEKFAWFINYVNGTHGGAGVNNANGKLTADLNMEAYGWVGIGSSTKPYTGTFDGNGHVITGLNTNYYDNNSDANYGLFSNLNGGTVKNVYIKDAVYNVGHTGGTYYIGSLVGKFNSGTVENSVVTGELIASNAGSYVGGLVGLQAGGELHSCYVVPTMTGYQMGGLVGHHTGGNLFNSFTNPQFTYSGTGSEYVGGLVAVNEGTVENCYVRLDRTQSLGSAKFGMLAGTNTGAGSTVQCYAPDGSASQFNHSYTYLYNNATTGVGQCDHYKKVDAPYLYNRPNDNRLVDSGKELYKRLNEWVSAQGTSSGYAYWKRTTAGGYATSAHAGNINDDYPIHKMTGSCCAGSTDAVFILYKPSFNRMINDYNTLGSGTIWIYASPKNIDNTDELVNVNNADGVKVYIDEDVSLKQADGNLLKAFTSQTLGDYTDPQRGERWHYCSSSLQQSTIGFTYGADNVGFSWDPNPCSVTFSNANDAAVFPGDLTAANIASVDLYAFYEPEYHWVNLKRNTNSHWHMNDHGAQIFYNGNGTGGNGNETYLVPGKGYLMSIDKEQLLQNWGTLNNGNVVLQDVTYTEANAWAGLLGYNVLGNPYQSYLDFSAFIAANPQLTASKDESEVTYATYDPKYGAYVQFKSGSSVGSKSADGLIHAHQGFLIRRTGGSASTTATFTNSMRSTTGTSPFRDEQPAFPLVNLTLTDASGNADIVVLEIGRDNDEGVEKLRVGDCQARISLSLDHEEYAILFRDETVESQALHLVADEAGTYTLSWETANAEFESLTLVDNLTGRVTDMLATGSYAFDADPSQYESRFKIVIGDWKDVEENEGGASTGSATATFAYQSGDEIIVDGEGRLEVVDMLGRVVACSEASQAPTLSTAGMTPGVYVLRLNDGKGTKVQKMIIK